MLDLTATSANELYAAACRAVLETGQLSKPRGMATIEVLNAHLCLTEPRRRYVDLPPARIINPAFAVAEAIWILSGSDDPWIFQYNKTLTKYADDGKLQGAYGPRMRKWRDKVDQLDHVRRLLARDPDTRQAVIQLFDAERDTVGHRDVPCTLGYRFFLRDGRLHMHTSMRSQDLWLGFPYDIFTATMIHELMAGWIGADVGEYHHFVDSLHLYDQHLDAARDVAQHRNESALMSPVAADWGGLAQLLDGVVSGNPLDPSWEPFARVLESYRLWQDGNHESARGLLRDADDLLGLALNRWYEHLTQSVSRR
ncbi:thymidylate synthase [Streptomyces sp. NBC_01538]|uniref:thymidylate synthase n=1 Tax=Streptomyces sp. NBC_01538 TaxID=2903897 RepID=UPI003865886B